MQFQIGGIPLDSMLIADPVHIGLRLLLAMILGGLIGIEREQNNHAAGFRTHILVCIGSALTMLISMYGFSAFANQTGFTMDPARLAAGVISGIGFLGAGVILYNGFSIKGLTTAASLWVVAAIGLAVGGGYYYGAVFTTIFSLFSLLVLNKVERKWFRRYSQHIIKVQIHDKPGQVSYVTSELEDSGFKVRDFTVKRDRNMSDEYEKILSIIISVSNKDGKGGPHLVDRIRDLDGVLEVSWE